MRSIARRKPFLYIKVQMLTERDFSAADAADGYICDIYTIGPTRKWW